METGGRTVGVCLRAQTETMSAIINTMNDFYSKLDGISAAIESIRKDHEKDCRVRVVNIF